MDLEEYEKIALQRLNKTIASNNKEKMNYACMGLMEESGEIIAEFRKPLFKGNFHEKVLNIENIKSELGDLIWYISLICQTIEIKITQVLKDNKKTDETMELNKREKLIELSINLGKLSGEIVKEYQEAYNKENNNQKLIEKVNEQYRNIMELASQLNITIDEILEKNTEKINARYKEDGEVNR